MEKLAALRPVFRANGTITAGSASPLSDGAATLVVMSRPAERADGLREFAEIRSSASVVGPDQSLHSQPSHAIAKALAREGRSVADLGSIEINEAFASVALHSADDLAVDPDRVNAEGGAIAIGYPVGASGARLALQRAGSGMVAVAHAVEGDRGRRSCWSFPERRRDGPQASAGHGRRIGCRAGHHARMGLTPSRTGGPVRPPRGNAVDYVKTSQSPGTQGPHTDGAVLSERCGRPGWAAGIDDSVPAQRGRCASAVDRHHLPRSPFRRVRDH